MARTKLGVLMHSVDLIRIRRCFRSAGRVLIFLCAIFFVQDETAAEGGWKDFFRVGEIPSYIDVSWCPEPALFIISHLNFPQQLIHSCKSEELMVGDKRVNLINIAYGPGVDCPAGCGYERYTGVVDVKNSTVFALPVPGTDNNFIFYDLSLQAPFKKRKYDFRQRVEKVTISELAQKGGDYGWKITFKKPWICSWVKIEKSRVRETKIVSEGKKYYETFSGSVFVYLKDGNMQWDLSELVHDKLKEENIIVEEKL